MSVTAASPRQERLADTDSGGERAERGSKWSATPKVALLIGGVALCTSALVGSIRGLPQPSVHDEFAYVLAGETFAAGRVTNPTPPSPEHFETFHVLMEPTYSSKYPPAQGLALAMGIRLFGAPIIGVWFSVALLCIAIYWMLLAWMPPNWAVLGGAIAVLQFAGGSYWAQSYWGGAVAGIGGALVYGSTRRWVVRPNSISGVLFSIGLGVLANSRPVEGAIVAAPVVVIVAIKMLQKAPAERRKALRSLVPGIVLLLGVGVWMAYFNMRVTGNPLRLPYLEYASQYQGGEVLSSGVLPEQLPHDVFSRFYEDYVLPETEYRSSLRHVLSSVANLTLFFWGPGVLVFWAVGGVVRDRWLILVLGVAAAVILISAMSRTAMFVHYFAPAACLFIVLITSMLRSAIMAVGDARTTKLISVAFMSAWVTVFAIRAQWKVSAIEHDAGLSERQRIVRLLEATPGKHLVLVRYGEDHNVHQEWVYNHPDIFEGTIIWARDLGDRNERLLEYFRDRTVWTLLVDPDPQLNRVSF